MKMNILCSLTCLFVPLSLITKNMLAFQIKNDTIEVLEAFFPEDILGGFLEDFLEYLEVLLDKLEDLGIFITIINKTIGAVRGVMPTYNKEDLETTITTTSRIIEVLVAFFLEDFVEDSEVLLDK